ncbi:hypothetical protein HK405_015724, partial [Cladochytrium tenue]
WTGGTPTCVPRPSTARRRAAWPRRRGTRTWWRSWTGACAGVPRSVVEEAAVETAPT